MTSSCIIEFGITCDLIFAKSYSIKFKHIKHFQIDLFYEVWLIEQLQLR